MLYCFLETLLNINKGHSEGGGHGYTETRRHWRQKTGSAATRRCETFVTSFATLYKTHLPLERANKAARITFSTQGFSFGEEAPNGNFIICLAVPMSRHVASRKTLHVFATFSHSTGKTFHFVSYISIYSR